MKAQPPRPQAGRRATGRARAWVRGCMVAWAALAGGAAAQDDRFGLEPSVQAVRVLGDEVALRERARAGRELFRGERPFANPPVLLQGVVLPRDQAACSRCHAVARGTAGRMLGRLRSQRDVQDLLRAVEQGRAPGGQPLQLPMPRYALSDDERLALVAYLQVLGTLDDPGIVELLAQDAAAPAPPGHPADRHGAPAVQ